MNELLWGVKVNCYMYMYMKKKQHVCIMTSTYMHMYQIEAWNVAANEAMKASLTFL